MGFTLIGGGSRSGKSTKALELASTHGAPLGFIATAQAFDDEMRERIARHRAERDANYRTWEEPLDIAAGLSDFAQQNQAVVLDCLTLWLTNVMLAGRDIETECSALVRACQACPRPLYVVTNEVGCGIVPENALARAFRDAAGRLNQQMAAAADSVYFMAFGCSLRLK